MDNQQTEPMQEVSIHDKFVAALSAGEESERDAPTELEQGEEVQTSTTAEADLDSYEDEDAEAQLAESGDEDQPEEQPQTFTLEINGETKEVTLDELKSGNMMQADYSRKTQELAEARKAFAEEQSKAVQQQSQVLGDLQSRVQMMDDIVQSLMTEGNLEELMDINPGEYLKQQKKIESIKQQADQQREFLRQEQAKYTEALRAQETERLFAAIPEWLDESKREAGFAKVRDAFGEYSFNDQEIGSLLDHRLIRMAHDLARYKARVSDLESRTAQVKEQVKTAAPLSKPQSNISDTSQRKKQELRKAMRTGKRGAAAEAFKSIL